MLDSSFAERFELALLDSTQISNPPPGLATRALFAMRRVAVFAWRLITVRPAAVLLFASAGGSLVEKGLMAWLTRLTGRPSLLFPRGGRVMDRARSSARSRVWVRAAFRGATVVLCQGPAWQDFMVQEMCFPVERAPIVPNWTATNRLLTIGAARVPRDPASPARLVFVGWLEPEKGVFELLDACRDLLAELDFALTIAGRGHAEAEARRRVQQHGLQDRVHFAGWLDGEDLESLLAASDVFVLPSWAEGLPNAMIEAMATGLAVVASAVGNIPHVLRDGREALLVPPRDVPALAAALRRVLRDGGLLQGLQRHGRELAAAHFAVEPAMDLLTGIVLQTLREPPARAL